MSYYLGLANSRTGLLGCLLEGEPEYLEPRPLYLNLTCCGSTPEGPLNHTLSMLEWTPRLAWATPPRSLPPYLPDAEFRRRKVQELELSPKEIDIILRHADRLQGRSFHRAHLAAWLALRDSQGDWRSPEDMAWDWLQHLARIRTDAPF